MTGQPTTLWQRIVLAMTATPMAAIGIAGGIASFYNFRTILKSDSFALSVVLAGEGATLVCALVILSLTLLGQHSPRAARAGLWILPIVASVAGSLLARTGRDAIVMAVAPLAMTVAGEGLALVARRVVAFQSGTDLEQQRRSGRLLWHSNRAVNGSAIGRRVSRVAVWRLTRQFAETDAQLGVQLGEVLRYRITEGADANMAAVLSGRPQRPSEATAVPARPEVPALPVREPGATLLTADEALRQEAVDRMANTLDVPAEILARDYSEFHEFKAIRHDAEVPQAKAYITRDQDPMDDGMDFINGVLAEAEAHVAADPNLRLMTTAEVAAQRGVKEATVRSWVHRKKLAVADRGPGGEALFSPLDVARLV